jgi:hypothetical protein
MQYTNPHYDSETERFSFYFGASISAFCVVFLTFSFIKVQMTSKEELEDPEFVASWGSIISEVKYKSRWNRAFNLIFSLKRALFIWISFNVRSTGVTLVSIILLILFSFIYLGINRPLSTKLRNRLTVFNEYILLTSCVTMMGFTDVIPDVNQRYAYGWVFITLILVVLVVNYKFIIMLSAKQF